MVLGPIAILQLKGMICPCLESDQDRSVRRAISNLNNTPVRYYSQKDGSTLANMGGLVSGFFGKKGGSSDVQSAGVVKGLMTVADTMTGPSLQFDVYESDDEEGGNSSNTSEKKVIHLRKVGGATATADSFLSKGSASITLNGKEEGDILLRFDIRVAIDSDTEADSEKRDSILDEIFILLEWNRQHGTTEFEENDLETLEPKKNAAEKLKHFAKREIEMQKQRRDREQRKAKYMKDSGGLKYTAIAMANREMS